MNKHLFSLLLCLCFGARLLAQPVAPLILEMRTLLKAAPKDFKSYRGTEIEKDEENGAVIYKGLYPTKFPTANHVVVSQPNIGLVLYLVRYTRKDLTENMEGLLEVLVQKYKAEMANMAKGGRYTTKEYTKEDGTLLTEVLNSGGHLVAGFRTTDDEYLLILYGTKKK